VRPASRIAGYTLIALAVWVVGFELHNAGAIALPEAIFGKLPSQFMQIACAVLLLARALTGDRRERKAWLAIGIGMSLWTAGDMYWTLVLYDMEEIPIPSPGDIGYLAAVPFLFSGFVLLARARLNHVPRTLWLDGLVAALAAAAVSAAVVLGRVTSGVSGTVPEVLTNLAYPVGDLALLAVIVGTIALARWRLDRTWVLLGLGVLSFWFADSLYLVTNANGTYDSGSWFDAGWNVAYLLWTAAAWSPQVRAAAVSEGGDLRVVVMPLLFALVSLGLLSGAAMSGMNPPAAMLATASLLAVFGRLVLAYRLNTDLLTASRHESLTDTLTGLGNRRRLTRDLERACEDASEDAQLVLVLFDLDGFKYYNDTFGHPAGDALLTRLGTSLELVVDGRGRAYRMGGDEFCALLEGRGDDPDNLGRIAARSLHARGEGFFVGCSFGAVTLPTEATSPEDALRLADQRMYAHKRGGRVSTERQSTDVLLRVLAERSPDLEGHTAMVASLAGAVAERLGLSPDRVADVRSAAELHDVGKVAIPDDILDKPSALSDEEWEFMRRHTLIGARIVAAAPALDRVAPLVRSSHERWDGTGYPDGLAGEAIPLGARIVAVCDAFDAMTSDRPYSPGMPSAAALMELRRCAGSQFDPGVVEAFCAAWGQAGVSTNAVAA
jgi:diguanylate cyclase (GGDEF)-like protein/putative nucleotidyltransferase with HDIG domain